MRARFLPSVLLVYGVLPACGASPAGPGAPDAGAWPPGDGAMPPEADAAMPPEADAGIPPDAEPPPPPPPPAAPDLEACWPGRWCWLEGAGVVAIDAADPGSIHAADRAGRLFRWTGAAWAELPGIRERRVHRVHVAAPDDVWVIAEHADAPGYFVDRWDGAAWSTSWPAADPGYLSGSGGDNVWIREAGSRRWLRFDGREWRSVEEPDPARYGRIQEEIVRGRVDPMLLPGPAPTAYALMESPGSGVPLVVRYDGRYWSPMGTLASGWSHLAWSEGEVRAIEYHGSSLGADSVELRFDGVRWVPVRTAPEGRYLFGSVRGVVVSPGERRCDVGVPAGGALVCAGAGRAIGILERGWTETALPQATRPFPDALWPEVAPGYWAPDAHAAWGSGPDGYVRVRAEPGTESSGALERVERDAPAPVRLGGEPIWAVHVRGVDGEAAWAWGDARAVRIAGASAEHVRGADGAPVYGVAAVAPVPGDGAWLVASTGLFAGQASVLRARGTAAEVDHVLPYSGFEDEVILVDVAAADDASVWVLGAIGHRERRGVIYHRDPAGAWREIGLPTSFWGAAQLAAHGGAIYLATGAGDLLSVARIPVEALAGDALAGALEDHELREGDAARSPGQRLPPLDLRVDGTGVWLTSATVSAWLPER